MSLVFDSSALVNVGMDNIHIIYPTGNISSTTCHKENKTIRFYNCVVEMSCREEEVREEEVIKSKQTFGYYDDNMSFYDNVSELKKNNAYNYKLNFGGGMIPPGSSVYQANNFFNHQYKGVLPKTDITQVLYGLIETPSTKGNEYATTEHTYKELNLNELTKDDKDVPQLFVDLYEDHIINTTESAIKILYNILMDSKYNKISHTRLTDTLMLCRNALNVINNNNKYPIGKISVVNIQHAPRIKLLSEVIESWLYQQDLYLEPEPELGPSTIQCKEIISMEPNDIYKSKMGWCDTRIEPEPDMKY